MEERGNEMSECEIKRERKGRVHENKLVLKDAEIIRLEDLRTK